VNVNTYRGWGAEALALVDFVGDPALGERFPLVHDVIA
jgi:hypothetical protein